MKLSRITAFITAAAMTVPFTACSVKLNLNSSSDTTSESASTTSAEASSEAASADTSGQKSSPYSQYDEIDTDLVREHTEKLLSDIKLPENSEAVKADIETLIRDCDAADESATRAQVHYCLNFSDEAAENAYDTVAEDSYIVSQFANYAFAHCFKNDEYSELVKDHVDEDSVEYYTYPGMSLKRLEGYARVDYNVSDDYTDRYYDIVDTVIDLDEDDEEAIHEAELKTAELYLELMKEIPPETFYDNYNRDYSPEVVFDLSDKAISELMKLNGKFVKAYVAAGGAEDTGEIPEEIADTFEAIRKYSKKLSPEAGSAAERLINEKQYIITDDINAYPGCATVSFPLTNSAAIFLNTTADDAFESAVHEFGHYYAAESCKTHSVDAISNMDVAEIQSQGYSMLFLRFYDDIYGDLAEAKRIETLGTQISAVYSAFMVGKFEYAVLKDANTLTPEEVLDLWDEIIGTTTNAYIFDIPHIFEQPGYYISYAVSGLAALQIWEVQLTSPDKALEMYQKLVKFDPYSKSTKFKNILTSCGFENVLTQSYISSLSDALGDYLDGIIDE